MARHWVLLAVSSAIVLVAVLCRVHVQMVWRVSSEEAVQSERLLPINFFGQLPAMAPLRRIRTEHTKIERRDLLTAGDGLHNVVCMAWEGVLGLPAWPCFAWHICAKWHEDPTFLNALAGAACILLFPVVYLGLLVLWWGTLLFTPATTGYYLLWGIAAVPALLAGAATGATPCHEVLVIIVIIR